jgi:hypothetical protein
MLGGSGKVLCGNTRSESIIKVIMGGSGRLHRHREYTTSQSVRYTGLTQDNLQNMNNLFHGTTRNHK